MAIPLTQRLKANWSLPVRPSRKNTSTPIHKLTAGDFVWTFYKTEVVKVMILEDYEKTNYATEDHSLVKFLVGDTTDLIPISNVTLSRDEWVSDYNIWDGYRNVIGIF